MKAGLFHIIPFSFLLLLLSSCETDCHKKGNCPPENYRFELGEAKQYLWAAPGSYWIYRNTKTGDLDTQTVTYCKTYWMNVKGTTKATQQRNVDYEVLSRGIYSSYNQWTYEDKTHKVVPNDVFFDGTYRVILDRLVGGQGMIYLFDFPFRYNAAIGNGSTTKWCKNIDTSIIIGDSLYKHAKVFELDMDDIWYPNTHPLQTRYPKTRYFWVRDIGLICRLNLSEKYSWELIDYKILQ